MTVWRSAAVWRTVADDLRRYRSAGLVGVMTEDTVRFAAARALVGAGVDPVGLRAEWPHPVLPGSRIDLAVGGRPPTALVEFKFPREPSEKNAAWTMVLGEVLKDLYRLASCPGEVDRLFVYLESARLHRYMASSADRYGLRLDTDDVVLQPADAARLPGTAARIIGADLAAQQVTARRLNVLPVDATLRLVLYLVDPLQEACPTVDARAARNHGLLEVGSGGSLQNAAPPVRRGARQEILAAIDAILIGSGGSTFTVVDVINELRRRGSPYAESTIRTMVTSHMCANVPGHAAATYDDLERVDRGTYRLWRAGLPRPI